MKQDVFISYSREDLKTGNGSQKESIIQQIINILQEEGISFWIDRDGIYTGDLFAEVIVNNIIDSRVFLFVSSKNSNRSAWTSKEIAVANKYNKPIIPFCYDDTEYNKKFMLFLVDIDRVDYYAEPSTGLERLKKAIIKRLEVIKEKEQQEALQKPDDIHDSLKKRTKDSHPNKAVVQNPKTDNNSQNKKTRTNLTQQAITSLNIDGMTAIDLGLPSGTKWASCNIGATKPEEYGSYFSWGEIEEKKEYNWKTYLHGYRRWFRWRSRDIGADICGTQYDAAWKKTDENWQLPSRNQVEELIKNCTFQWIKLKKVKGILLISKINEKCIFLPAAGYYNSNMIMGDGIKGYYWSGSIFSNFKAFSACLCIRNDDFSKRYNEELNNSCFFRYYGCTIRPVATSCQNDYQNTNAGQENTGIFSMEKLSKQLHESDS